MRLTVLGKSPAWEDAQGACSGYLIESESKVLLDCGNGVVGKLQSFISARELDAVVVSHMHADHFFDLIPLAYLLRYAPPPLGQPDKDVMLYLPLGGKERLKTLGEVISAPDVLSVFRVCEYSPGDVICVGDLNLLSQAVPHYVSTCAFDVRSNTHRFTYGADCGPNDALASLAQNTPLLISEATMPHDQDEGHMSAHQAGQVAQSAHAQRLMLTHFSELYQPQHLLEEANREFSSLVVLAREGLQAKDSLASVLNSTLTS